MTAAQIIDKYFPRSKEDCYLKTVYEKETIEMLDEYARIRSIEFENWRRGRNRILSDEAGQMPITFSKYETPEELYELFSQQSLK